MLLIDWAVPISTADISQVPADGPFEEALATLARRLPVVLSRALVTTHDALQEPMCSAGSTSATPRVSGVRRLFWLPIMFCRLETGVIGRQLIGFHRIRVVRLVLRMFYILIIFRQVIVYDVHAALDVEHKLGHVGPRHALPFQTIKLEKLNSRKLKNPENKALIFLSPNCFTL